MQRKLVLIFLAFLMLLSIVACGQLSNNSKGNTATAANNSADVSTVQQSISTQDDIMTPYGKYKDPVTFTSGRAVAPKLPADQTYENNKMTRYIEDKINVKVKNAWVVDQNTYDQKVALVIASGDIPDVMAISDRKTLQQMQDAGLLADLTEAYDKCISPFLKEQYDSFNGTLLKEATFDGKLMAIPGTNIGGAQNMLWIRKDWLDKVGMQPPKTIDDIISVAKAFIEKDPGGNGPGKTIGLTGRQEVTGLYNSMHGLDTIFSLYGAYPRHWIKDSSGNVIYGSIAAEMKQALSKLNEMYKAGIIDKQFAMRKDTDSNTLVTSGKCGMMFGAWWAPYYPLNDGVKNNPKADWKPYLAPLDSEGNLNAYTQDPVNKFLVVRKGFEHPEAIIKVLNCENDLYRGTNPEAAKLMQEVNSKGEDWGEPFVLQVDYNDAVYRFYTALKAAVDSNDPSKLRDDYKGAYSSVIKNKENPGADPAAWAEATARIDGQALTYVPQIKFHNDVFYGTTPTMEMKWTNLKKLEDENIIQFIMGDKPIDQFDKFVEEWKQLGGDQITNEVKGMVK